MWETEEGSISLSCSICQLRCQAAFWLGPPTGTFFCESTTAQSLPLTPMDMMFAAVMALKAYSGGKMNKVSVHALLCGPPSPACRLRPQARMVRRSRLEGLESGK